MASANLTDGNPNIADLSDENRPTRLAEQFSELYDNEWTDAFGLLTLPGKVTEKEACTILLNMLYVSNTCYSHGFIFLKKYDSSVFASLSPAKLNV
jgi:hypothetical protein